MSIRQTFRQQAEDCARMGSPFMARLMSGLAAHLQPGNAVADHILALDGQQASRAYALPLRLAGGLHALVLSGQEPALARAYADLSSDPTDAALVAIARHPAFLQGWLQSPPQTNEVRRSAVLIAAAHWLTARIGLPMVLSELGASAGLNLLWDHYALTIGGQGFGPQDPALTLTPGWTGPLPPDARPVVAARAGVDLNPLDPVADRVRLLSWVWPDQPDRIARTIAAADLAAGFPGLVAQGDAADWLERRLARPFPGHLHLIFHTIAWQYFPPATLDRITALLAQAGARATPGAPLAHLSMEADATPGSAAVTLTLWPGGQTRTLARAGFHGQVVDWLAAPGDMAA